jgi:sn-glycerol 3-phosphate transport system permease protein
MNKPRLSARSLLNTLGLAALGILALAWTVPILWAFAVSVHSPDEPLSAANLWWGTSPTLINYVQAFDIAPFARYYLNTVVIVLGILFFQLTTICLAGYAFARFQFRGQNFLFFLIMLQLLLPASALIVPNYATIRVLGVFDTLFAVMVPSFGSAFGTFLMRQTFK